MAKVLVNEENLTNIANAIREKNGKITTYKPGDMASAISSIETGGGSVPEKGIVINAFDNNGYVTELSAVGMVDIPNYFLGANETNYYTIINKNIEKVNLPDNVTTIGDYAFYYLMKLKTINLSDSLTSIGVWGFKNCMALELSELPKNLVSIGAQAFYYCKNVRINKLPDTVTTLGKATFRICTGINSLIVPHLVTIIPEFCFFDCENMTKIEIQGDITTIENRAFSDCILLTNVSLVNITSIPTLANIQVFNNTPIASGTGYIYVPDTLVDSFKTATNWSTYADQIKPISELEVNE